MQYQHRSTLVIHSRVSVRSPSLSLTLNSHQLDTSTLPSHPLHIAYPYEQTSQLIGDGAVSSVAHIVLWISLLSSRMSKGSECTYNSSPLTEQDEIVRFILHFVYEEVFSGPYSCELVSGRKSRHKRWRYDHGKRRGKIRRAGCAPCLLSSLVHPIHDLLGQPEPPFITHTSPSLPLLPPPLVRISNTRSGFTWLSAEE